MASKQTFPGYVQLQKHGNGEDELERDAVIRADCENGEAGNYRDRQLQRE